MNYWVGVLLSVAATAIALDQAHLKENKPPNIVLILTDDQDLHMNSLEYMPLLKKHIIDKGTYFKRHYCSTAICCPSRVTLWTGRNAHNTNVTHVVPPYGEFAYHCQNRSWISKQVDTQNLFPRASMRITSPSGSRMQDIALTTPENFLMHIPSRTGTLLTQQVGHLLISSLIPTRMNT